MFWYVSYYKMAHLFSFLERILWDKSIYLMHAGTFSLYTRMSADRSKPNSINGVIAKKKEKKEKSKQKIFSVINENGGDKNESRRL